VNLIGRYIFREAFGSWLVVMAVLFVIFMTNQLADILGDAAANTLPREAVLAIFGLTALRYLTLLMPITLFLIGLTLWLCGKIVDARQTLKAAVVVAAYSYMPRVLESLVVGLQGLLMDVSRLTGRYQVTLSAARFSDPDATSPALLAILGRFDVFIIWVTVLLAIGLAVTGKIPRGKAAIAAFLVWLLGSLPTVLPALRQ